MTRFFYHPESDCLFTTDTHPSGPVDELTEPEYCQLLAKQLTIWAWQGKWWVVHGQNPLYSCAFREDAANWFHGRTGTYPSQENFRAT